MFFLKKRQGQRVLFEDILKHIYHCQSEHTPATAAAIAGRADLRVKGVLKLAGQMQVKGLIRLTGEGFVLTPAGEAWALQVVRAHRLWESYLSERMGVPLERIHQQAEHKEHELSRDQTAALEARLGYPHVDPHGDPIPSLGQKGDKDYKPGMCLLDWPVEKLASVVHVEDEPTSVYTHILGEGIMVNTILKVLESTEKGLHIWTVSRNFWAAPIVAANIFVESAPEWYAVKDIKPLTVLRLGQKARVVALNAPPAMRRRYMDLGLVPGTVIEAGMSSMMKDPKAYRLRGSTIALRRDQANQILIKPLMKDS